MGMQLGGISGAITGVSTALGKEKSLKAFLSRMSQVGFQIKSRYEVNFSGLSDITFFVTSINTPARKQNFTQLYYEGKVVEIPVNTEYEHDFQMTVINDGSGYAYSAMYNIMCGDASAQLSNAGYKMTIKLIGDNKSKGSMIQLNGVRIKNVSGLDFSSDDGGISTFQVQCSAIDVNVAPGAIGNAAALVGGLGGLF